MPPFSKFKRLDVRPLCQRGEEPFQPIVSRIESLPADGGLLVIAPFLPSPLIELLGSRGFQSKVERGEGSSWMVYFWHRSG